VFVEDCEGYVRLDLRMFVDDGYVIAHVTEDGTETFGVSGEATKRTEVRGLTLTLAGTVNRVVEGARGVSARPLRTVIPEPCIVPLVDDLAHVLPVRATPP